MNRNRFTNPADGTYWDWVLNHDEEQPWTLQREIEATANTGNVGLVRQQGDDQPMILRFSGKILQRAHLDSMLWWFALCANQTIFFKDVDDNELEVQITAFNPRRMRASKNPRDVARRFYWTYEIELMVFRSISGQLSGVVS